MRRTAHVWAAVTGLISAAAVLAAAEIIAIFAGAATSPVFAVGSLAIDLAPPGVKSFMIAVFGTGDKAALLVILGILVVALAALAGILEYRRPPFGLVVLVLVSGIAVLAVTTRAGASGLSGIPTVVGMIVGVLVLRMLARRLRAWTASAAEPVPLGAQTGLDRRRFLTAAGITALVAAFGGVIARAMNAAANAVSAARDAVVLPAAATPAPAVPASADLGLEGLTPYITPNEDFYRIDTALQVPALATDNWKLRVTGLVDQPVEIGWDELLALPLEEHVVTLACVSNEVGGDLIGNAVWLGYPIREILKKAAPQAGADMVLSVSTDGFTAGTPLEALQDEGRVALLAVGMNGQPLPVEHGFPVRMVVAGLYGYVSATKWVTELRVTRFADAEGYWTPRGWSALGPIKTESRIDVPRAGATVAAGKVAVAGVAWAQHTGVSKVEVQVDGGDWAEARLAGTTGVDTWVQWVYEWDAPAGQHTLAVRATDASGATQTDVQAPPAPDGASGWDTVRVTVS
ncbi:molybdopterin-dependent oxidoreductase [Herbiconiux solani]|uniref:molybdopterin-dependent oxidoreductase n=1 Tax=Herbiconiux solani TaxID=661329 RepID=UPI0008260D82|nr:molybdopterin-dependent oxidoreductase [Herbiconiux solani]